jgi:PAS domain S-box-containing protein
MDEAVEELKREIADLRLMLQAAVEHGDVMENILQNEINQRKLAQNNLQTILTAVRRSKADIEIMLEAMVEHGETVIEYELQQSQEALFKVIAEATPIAMLVCGASDRLVTYANTKAYDLLGRGILHQSIENLVIIENDWHRLEAQLQAEGKVEAYELQMYQVDGSPFWAVASVHPLSLHGQTVLLYTLFDITERKRAEARLQSSEAILREQAQLLEIAVEARTLELQAAEEKYRRIFENALEGIYQSTADSPAKFLVVNPALARIYKYDNPAQLIAAINNIDEQVYVDRERRKEFIQLVTTKEKVTNFESEVYCRDGSKIWITENGKAVRDDEGSILFFEGSVQDITAKRIAESALRQEQTKSERLLLNILPRTVAERLKSEQIAMIADSYSDVSILFADIVEFTSIASRISPREVVGLLNSIFSAFDALAEKYHLEKIKTIGDEYMVVGGLPDPHQNHAQAIANMALDMQETIKQFATKHHPAMNLRIGINTGSVVAGVIGQTKFSFDLWGDAVNLASRMETQGEPGKIQVSETTYLRLQDQFRFHPRGVIFVKGKGEMPTYWLEGRK